MGLDFLNSNTVFGNLAYSFFTINKVNLRKSRIEPEPTDPLYRLH